LIDVGWTLDPFGEDDRAGPLAVRHDGRHDRRLIRRRPLAHQRHVQLDDVGRQEREQRERRRVGADVVEGDAPSTVTCPLHQPEQFGRPAHEGPLRQLQDHAQPDARRPEHGRRIGRPRRAERLGFDVHEQGHITAEADVERPAQRRQAAGPVELSGAPREPGRSEHCVWSRARQLGPAGKGLERDDLAIGQVDDRLVRGFEQWW
jgi:hypothetical protein